MKKLKVSIFVRIREEGKQRYVPPVWHTKTVLKRRSQDIPVPFERFSNPSRPDATAKAKVEALKHAVAVNPQSAETWIDLGWRL